jgi:DNA-binding Xre family transcriptional regulator
VVCYKKLWKLLIDKDLKKQEFVALVGISPTTMAKLNRGDNLNTDVLVRICNALQCKASDMMEIYPDEQGDDGKK